METAASSYLSLHDPQITHLRRVRAMVTMAAGILMVLGLAYGIYFALRQDWLVVTGNFGLVAIGLIGIALQRMGHSRAAVLVIIVSLFLVFAAMAAFLDLPSMQIPRSIHHFFIVLGVAAYLVAKDEPAWIRLGLPLACLFSFVLFCVPEVGIPTRYAVPDDVREAGNWANNFFAMAVLYLLVHVFIGDIARMERFLQNANSRFVSVVGGMFPKSVAERLLSSGEGYAERHEQCSILFADIVGFTRMAAHMQPEALVLFLAEVFRRFDACVEACDLTKIKTIGDAYMVVAGVPHGRLTHATDIIALAQQMIDAVKDMPGIQLRIGIASGDLVAGVIGKSRQVFDVWGDSVNMASRMESHGLPGRIHVSESSFYLAKHRYTFEKRADMAIKGKSGHHNTYLVSETA